MCLTTDAALGSSTQVRAAPRVSHRELPGSWVGQVSACQLRGCGPRWSCSDRCKMALAGGVAHGHATAPSVRSVSMGIRLRSRCWDGVLMLVHTESVMLFGGPPCMQVQRRVHVGS